MRVHFIGIGGTGMGALARMLQSAGHEIRGSDSALYPPMSTQLRRAGIPAVERFSAANLEWGPDCVVVGNVCSKDHVEVVEAQRLGLPLESMPSLLSSALLSERRPLVIAGTHGKTTTASILAWLLRCAGQDPSWFIGGVPKDLGTGGELGTGRSIVLEGDEYDTAFFDKGSKFLHYRPAAAILTGVEFDHADIFKDIGEVRATFSKFVELLPKDGYLVVHRDDPDAMATAGRTAANIITYRVIDEASSDFGSADYVTRGQSRVGARRTSFSVYEHGSLLGEFSTMILGLHNLQNLTAALAVARQEGCELAKLQDAVVRFRGVQRRQELVGTAQGVRVIEDFAHHPTAVRLTVEAIRRRYPEKTLHVCFEPRSATSRRRVSFAGYSEAFDLAGSVYIAPLHAPEKIPEAERLNTAELATALRARGVEAQAFERLDAILDAVIERAGPGDSVLVLSSGGFASLSARILDRLGDPVVPKATEDVPAINSLMASYGLPELRDPDSVQGLVIRGADRLVGCVNLEVAGESAYLFGLAVVGTRRGEGLGWVLADSVLRHARTLGARRVYLLPRDSADFFASKLGFEVVSSDSVDPAVRACANFQAAASGGGAYMVCELSDAFVG